MTTSTPPKERVSNTRLLWERFADEHGEMDPDAITDTGLEALQRDIKTGAFPPVMVADDHEGWLLYARSTCERAFIRYRIRAKIGGISVRGFVPTALEPGTTGPWVSVEDRPDAAVAHAEHRLSKHVIEAIALHGATILTHAETPDLEEVRAMGYAGVDEGIEILREALAQAGKESE